ncbi:MAG: ATP phosphoribosyltransferase regulatory subunit, partial [Alphaproteobacteria bacterium]|nr:ATP phosphoribosyltransferase regulatory subunit [Alphaproteobacteria bacterium]
MKSSISGFPEFLPNEQIVFNKVVSLIKQHFEEHGFVPMDTAAVERVSTLLAKGNDNEIYGIYRLADETATKKDLGLRFDLTVPLARYVAENSGQLIFPHKRYQVSPVWRGERPQYGRYRQFYQCDIDIVGDTELSIEHDAEIISVIIEVLRALGIPRFHTKLNNRKILQGFLLTLVTEDKIQAIIQLIDKLDKITPEDFDKTLSEIGVSVENISRIKSFLEV